jgi:KDO2-lipid IV(A) lauroyltransferase
MRDAVDVVRTFANFASCLTEVLSTGSKNDCPLASTVHRGPRVDDLLASAGGLIFVTAHTAGWERLGALLAGEHRKRVLLVMRRERDEQARELQDATRRVPGGVSVLHVGDDPFASLPLMHHLRGGGAVAMQIDRVPPGMTGHAVQLFGRPALIPEGPLRLAQLSGAPLVPVFSARRGHRRYSVHVHEPIRIARRAGATAVDAAAQQIADALGQFVSTHPTQWFSFRE